MVVLASDMNGHVGSSNVGNDGMHGGFGYGDRNADGSRILQFADGLNLVICNIVFMKQESQLVTYAASPVLISMVDYIIVQQEEKAKVRNVKVITNEECVPKHKFLVMDIRFNTTKRWRKKSEQVSKLEKRMIDRGMEGARPRGRPNKTWREIVEKDCRVCGLNREDAMDCRRWMKQIRDD